MVAFVDMKVTESVNTIDIGVEGYIKKIRES